MKKRAMVLHGPDELLVEQSYKIPALEPEQVLVKVTACGLCRTDLHILDNDLTDIKYPIVPGHEIIGEIIELGSLVSQLKIGMRVGISWLGKTCGSCPFCLNKQENLCDNILFTGFNLDGGFASHVVAFANYCLEVPENYSNEELAPFLCAGLIGWRALKFTQDAQSIGLYGFGVAAHLSIQVLIHQQRTVWAFTRSGDTRRQEFAKSLGASMAMGSDEIPIQKLDAAIIYAPDGSLILNALKSVKKGGIIVCAGIHMSDIPTFPYSLLWQEKSIKSVANLTRIDGQEFLNFIKTNKIKSMVTKYDLKDVNNAVDDMRQGKLFGAAVITP